MIDLLNQYWVLEVCWHMHDCGIESGKFATDTLLQQI